MHVHRCSHTCRKFHEMEMAAQLKPTLERTARRARITMAARMIKMTVPASISCPAHDSHFDPFVL